MIVKNQKLLSESIKCEHTRRVNAEKMRSIAEERIKKLVKREKELELNIEEFEAERHLHSHATDTIIDSNFHQTRAERSIPFRMKRTFLFGIDTAKLEKKSFLGIFFNKFDGWQNLNTISFS